MLGEEAARAKALRLEDLGLPGGSRRKGDVAEAVSRRGNGAR